MKVELRFAHDSDGPRVAEIAQACGFVFEGYEVDWSRLEPYWIVATIDERIVAALQVLPAYPIGRIDYLMIDPELGMRERAVTARRITDRAQDVLRLAGCPLAGSTINPEEDASYLRVAERRGWVVWNHVVSVVKRMI